MGDQVGSHRFKVIRGISKKIKENKNYKYCFLIFFSKKSFFKKITEITCIDGIAVPTTHHRRWPIVVPMAGPVPTTIWSVPTPA
jgi:hypothetical protein